MKTKRQRFLEAAEAIDECNGHSCIALAETGGYSSYLTDALVLSYADLYVEPDDNREFSVRVVFPTVDGYCDSEAIRAHRVIMLLMAREVLA